MFGPHSRTAQEFRSLYGHLSTSTVLVTGANRGLGRALAAELLSRGASVHAAARNPDKDRPAGCHPIALDITNAASVAAAAQATGDVTVLINNAGISTSTDLLAGALDNVRLEMDTKPLVRVKPVLVDCPLTRGVPVSAATSRAVIIM
jgi:NAD(P)-dependent dehydrogenase (short-subunit alcohol dehydrogenase family)